MNDDELRTKVIETFDTMPREWLVGMLACVGVRVAE